MKAYTFNLSTDKKQEMEVNFCPYCGSNELELVEDTYENCYRCDSCYAAFTINPIIY